MQTQCPHCQTFFHITDEQLQLADGQVRCGQCDEVFDAELVSIPDVPTLEDTSQTELSVDELSVDTLDDVHVDVVEISIPNLEPSVLDTDKLILSTEEQEAVIVKLNQPSLRLVNNGNHTDKPNAPQPELNEIQVSTLATIHTDLQAANEHPQQQPEEKPEHDTQDEIPTLLEQHKGYDASQLYPELDDTPAVSTPTIPKRYILAGVFLIIIFMGQSVFLLRDRLAEQGFRPLMQSLCDSLNCELALPRAPQEIILKTREIRSHPNINNALSVKATINNQASFVQSYPLLQIQFHDIEGRIIAGRDFLPQEYLPDDINLKKGIAPNNPVNIALELVDPGKNAVSFLFIFK